MVLSFGGVIIALDAGKQKKFHRKFGAGKHCIESAIRWGAKGCADFQMLGVAQGAEFR